MKPHIDPLADPSFSATKKFILEFEHICNVIENSIMSMLRAEGLQNENILEALMPGIPPETLINQFESIYCEHLNLNRKEETIVHDICLEFSALIPARNQLLSPVLEKNHTLADTAVISIQHYRISERGRAGDRLSVPPSESDILQLYRHACGIHSNINMLRKCLLGYPVEQHFCEIDNGKFVPAVSYSPNSYWPY